MSFHGRVAAKRGLQDFFGDEGFGDDCLAAAFGHVECRAFLVCAYVAAQRDESRYGAFFAFEVFLYRFDGLL